MTRRYYVPDLPGSGGMVTLTASEAHHATHVMRVQIGDEAQLFDGKGNQSQAVFVALGRNECHCDAKPCERVDREPSRSIHLGVALPKADRARELVERLTELGVQAITPLVAERTQRPPSDASIEKMRRAVIEACKQSGRNHLMQVLPTQDAGDFFQSCEEEICLIAHQQPDAIALREAECPKVIVAAIGPEGGWTDVELNMATARGFRPIDLGPRIYRIETAATVIASVLVT